jgi:hypothetical protein
MNYLLQMENVPTDLIKLRRPEISFIVFRYVKAASQEGLSSVRK